jgi:hypothetical protein
LRRSEPRIDAVCTSTGLFYFPLGFVFVLARFKTNRAGQVRAALMCIHTQVEGIVTTKANAGGPRRKNAAESAGDAPAVINEPATPAAGPEEEGQVQEMNFHSPDNQELMNEAIQGFHNAAVSGSLGSPLARTPAMCLKRPGSLCSR